jgi:lantibiotic modifying enzyme
LNRALDRLLGDAVQHNPGVTWNEWNDLFSETAGSKEYPNFSHGTAGIGYFLSELYEATKDERYLLSALAAGHYLQSIVSKAESSQYLIFHDDAGGRNLFYFGWCHGPAGTGRFFYRLSQLTNDPRWPTLVRNQAMTLMASGIPE